MDLNYVTGLRLGEEFPVFVTFCTKEEGKPLETRTDQCLFSSMTDDFFARRFARSCKHLTILLIEGGVNHALSTDLCELVSVDTVGQASVWFPHN